MLLLPVDRYGTVREGKIHFVDDSTFEKGGSFDWLNVNDPDYLGETEEIMVSEITNCINDFEK